MLDNDIVGSCHDSFTYIVTYNVSKMAETSVAMLLPSEMIGVYLVTSTFAYFTCFPLEYELRKKNSAKNPDCFVCKVLHCQLHFVLYPT